MQAWRVRKGFSEGMLFKLKEEEQTGGAARGIRKRGEHVTNSTVGKNPGEIVGKSLSEWRSQSVAKGGF